MNTFDSCKITGKWQKILTIPYLTIPNESRDDNWNFHVAGHYGYGWYREVHIL